MTDFWNKIDKLRKKAGINDNTFRIWKSRGRVSYKSHGLLMSVARESRVKLDYEELK